MPYACTVMERIAALARISEHPRYLLRRSYTDAMREANRAVAGWMEQAGMTVHIDSAGNLVGRYGGDENSAPTFIFGSHLDSVRDAGAYDGPLGVLLALAVVERMRSEGLRLPFQIELICFADEEGLRWGTAYLGSKAIAGTFDRDYLDRVDADGVPLSAALRAFGGDPDHIDDDRREPSRMLGYCEAHIEQGPVLETHGLPVGIVTAIAGQSRFTITLIGTAGHAGTVPMALRHDALCAAAEFVLAVETYARLTPGLVATVGQLTVEPGASNVVPGHVRLSLDVRHAEDSIRMEACRTLHERMATIVIERGVEYHWETVQETGAVACDTQLAELLARATQQVGVQPFHLPSGAGHDAVAMADLTTIVMLFVRCAGGISHNPAESVAEPDVAVAIDVMTNFLTMLATTYVSRVIEQGATS